MIEPLPDAIRRLTGCPSTLDQGGVVRIETTRPVFLLFGAEAAHPLYVAQFGPQHEVEPVHRLMCTLHARVPDLVPASFACVHWARDEYLHVYAGLDGVPWFRLRDTVRTPAAWADLGRRASDALQRLHSAIRDCEGLVSVNIAAQLRSELAMAQTDGAVARSPQIVTAIAEAADNTEPLGTIEWHAQHGDFCLNNLIVGSHALGIIDFEEFGQTAMPLHDELGLALSLHQLSCEPHDWAALRRLLADCARPTLRSRPELSAHFDALLFHHLIWRINQCARRPSRLALAVRLRNLLALAARVQLGGA